MHKTITKQFIILILMGILLTGCDKKSTEIVLTEPDTLAMNDENIKAQQSDSDDKVEETETDSSAESAKELGDKGNSSVEASKEPELPETIMVHVCGAVLCEGVYELPSGSRVVDAIKAAGGFIQDADSDFVNQALILSDGVKIRIPTMEESLQAEGDDSKEAISTGSDMAGITGMAEEVVQSSSSDGGKVDINTASESELCTIPGIGPGRAKNIIAFREENGKFGTIDDIKKVSGIKDKFFSKIKDHIKV